LGSSKSKVSLGAVTLLLFAAIIASILVSSPDFFESGRPKLPIGNGKPAISLGERHGLILASDGSLWTWGADLLGWPVLGLGSNMLKSTALRRIGSDTNWIQISAGSTHSLALKSDGTIWTWGQSVLRQSVRPTPIYFPVLAAPGNDWKQVAAGDIDSAALKKDGTLWTWGNNWSGALGNGSTNGSAVPVQVGTSTNWVRVWARNLETVALQADGSLWYWGENPDPAVPQDSHQIVVPTRVGTDTNWVDVGFGPWTVLAIKSDGTLWSWGRNAEVYTGLSSNMDATPMRVGTNSDWRSISDCNGWWCEGLIKKDGSLWLMDASDGGWNGPRPPFKPPQFLPAPFQKPYAAYAGGSAHALAPGDHRSVGVVLTPEGEVWTWGIMMGDPPTLVGRLRELGERLRALFHGGGPIEESRPAVIRKEPWRLRNVDGDDSAN
jgi:alpha-tubulin suppressor-like RCC1 family protein